MKSLSKMSYQANKSREMEESSGNAIESNFHLPLLINDPNGNEFPCSKGISPEMIHVTTPLTNGNCECPETQIFSFNVGVDVKTIPDQTACRLHGIYRPELEMARDYFCDHKASVVTNSQSNSSDYQCSWSSKCSATSTVLGQCMLDHKQNHIVKSQLPCRKASGDYHAADTEGKLNACDTYEAHLQKSLEHCVTGDGLKLRIIDSPNDTMMRITMNMERNLGHSTLPSESKLEMKHSNVGSQQHESSVPVLESSVFYNDSDSTFESQCENEILNTTQIIYQLPLEANFNSKESNQYIREKAEKILSEPHFHDPSAGPTQYPSIFNPNKNFREVDCNHCVKHQPKETNGQLSIVNKQCEEIKNKMAITEMSATEAYEMPTNSAMNTTFIVLKDINNDSPSEINSCKPDAQELVSEAEISCQETVNDETFSVSSCPTVHKHENSYSQTSTPLPASQKMIFSSSPLQNLTDLSDGDSSSAQESPTTTMLQSDARDSVLKPAFKIKYYANMKPRLSKVEIKSYPKPNFNNVKPKVVSRTEQKPSVPKDNVCLSTEVSCKRLPKSVNFISSLDSPYSRTPVPNHKKEPLSKSSSKTKADIVKIQKIVFRKRLSVNEAQTPNRIENKTSKSSRGNKPRTRASLVSAFAGGAGSRVSGSLHFSKSSLSSVGVNRGEHKSFQSDGMASTNSPNVISAVGKPRVRCHSLANAIDDCPVSFNPVSAAALESLHTTEVPLTESLAPSIGDVRAERRPRSNTKDQTVPSPATKLKVPSSISNLRLGHASHDGHSGNMHGSTNKQLLISAAVASPNRGDGPKKGVLATGSRIIQKPCAKSLQKNKVVSMKTPCRGVNRNASTSSQCASGSGSAPRSTRQLSTSQNLKTDRTWVKSSSSTQKPGFQTTRTSTRAPPALLPVVKKSPGLPHYKAKCEKQFEWIVLLKELLKTSNQRFEAVAIVVQYLQAQREEVSKQHEQLSQELLTLRGELELRNVTFLQLEKDREELRNKYEGVIQKLSEEHKTELEELERRLEELFTAEKEHLQQNFKNDVKKLQAELQKEIEGLTSKHEAHKMELSATHSKNLQYLQIEYQQSLAELTRSHELEQKTLEENFKERQSLLQDQIRKLNEENESLKEEIKTKEEVTKTQVQKSQKMDPLSLYLKQELDSLKAVLEIKNEKIHNQEKKLMQVEKLMEKHSVLDDKLKIVLQENEDLKARMDKHIAVSRQLSTEQVVLQESLQKESKVNKRLSMENEELLWKLQNGDVLGPKKLSPTSSLSFQPSKTSVSSSSNPAPSPR